MQQGSESMFSIKPIRCFNYLQYFQKNLFSRKMTADTLQTLALKEKCILVDENDKAIGSASKEDCHCVDPSSGSVKLHRGFSVFLFNTDSDILIHKRSAKKVKSKLHSFK